MRSGCLGLSDLGGRAILAGGETVARQLGVVQHAYAGFMLGHEPNKSMPPVHVRVGMASGTNGGHGPPYFFCPISTCGDRLGVLQHKHATGGNDKGVTAHG